MITFLKSDKGLEMFSKAHGIPKDDLVGFLDSKKADDFYNHQHSSPTDAEDKHDEGKLHLSLFMCQLKPSHCCYGLLNG